MKNDTNKEIKEVKDLNKESTDIIKANPNKINELDAGKTLKKNAEARIAEVKKEPVRAKATAEAEAQKNSASTSKQYKSELKGQDVGIAQDLPQEQISNIEKTVKNTVDNPLVTKFYIHGVADKQGFVSGGEGEYNVMADYNNLMNSLTGKGVTIPIPSFANANEKLAFNRALKLLDSLPKDTLDKVKSKGFVIDSQVSQQEGGEYRSAYFDTNLDKENGKKAKPTADAEARRNKEDDEDKNSTKDVIKDKEKLSDPSLEGVNISVKILETNKDYNTNKANQASAGASASNVYGAQFNSGEWFVRMGKDGKVGGSFGESQKQFTTDSAPISNKFYEQAKKDAVKDSAKNVGKSLENQRPDFTLVLDDTTQTGKDLIVRYKKGDMQNKDGMKDLLNVYVGQQEEIFNKNMDNIKPILGDLHIDENILQLTSIQSYDAFYARIDVLLKDEKDPTRKSQLLSVKQQLDTMKSLVDNFANAHDVLHKL